MPEDKLKDVSPAYCFLSLLFLANENGLQLHKDDETKDLLVTQPVKS